MAIKTVPAEELLAMARTDLGVSDWVTLDQERINQFADCTEDHQFIHINEEAAAKPPLGAPLPTFLTIDAGEQLTEGIGVHPKGLVMGVNYGLNKVRFLNPVRAGKRVRAHVQLTAVEQKDANRFLMTQTITVEIEGEETPALVAEWLGMSVTGG